MYQNNKEMQHSYKLRMDVAPGEGIHNVKYSSMRTQLFLAIRRTPNEMIDEPMEIFEQHLKVKAVQQDIDWYKVNTDEFNVESEFHMHLCK